MAKQPLGIELVKRGIVSETDIEKALDYQKIHPKKKIGYILNILKLCDPNILINAIGEILDEKAIYLQENDLESARKYVNNSLKINPKNKTALDLQDLLNSAESQKYINSIISSYEAQNYAESMRLVDEALKINKKDPNLYFYKALNYIAQNNYAASTAHLYKCLELDKNNIQVYFYLGLAFDNLSESKNALTYYKKYIELLPKDVYGESEKLDYAKARISKLQN